jgi:hypothetical protein
VVERIFNIWLEAADSFESSATPEVALRRYIARKMELSRAHRYGSKVWANEVMQGAPIIQDYLEVDAARLDRIARPGDPPLDRRRARCARSIRAGCST